MDFCVYFVYLRCADRCVIVLGNLRSALCGFVRMCFDSTIHYFANCFYYSMLRLLIQLLWLFYFGLYFGWLTVPHKTPLSGVRRLKGLVTELCWPSDRDLVTLPLWQATWELNTNEYSWCHCSAFPLILFYSFRKLTVR